MKTTGVFAILLKELIHMARDPATILFSMLPPIIQVIAFGFAINTDVRNLSTVIFDLDGKESSRALVESFENTGVFRITQYVSSHDELVQILIEGRAVAGIAIPPEIRLIKRSISFIPFRLSRTSALIIPSLKNDSTASKRF